MATTTQPTIKPGWKSTEFWVAILTPIILFACNKAGIDIPEDAITGLIAGIVPYILSRGAVKVAEVRRIPPK